MPRKAVKKSTTIEGFEVATHVFVPKHELLDAKEKAAVIESYGESLANYPKIMITDAAIRHLSAKEGDLIRITRESPTAGKATFYRVVVKE